MAFDQTYCMDTLTAATRPEADRSEFIYSFLDAYAFPKATVTQVRNGGQRNLGSAVAPNLVDGSGKGIVIALGIIDIEQLGEALDNIGPDVDSDDLCKLVRR